MPRLATLARRTAIAIAMISPLAPAAARAAAPITPTIAPQNPFMAQNPFGNIHDDTWMTDAYQIAGPRGSNLQTSFGAYPASLCSTMTFDARGRIISVCPSAGAPPQARIIDASSLKVLASYDLPQAPDPPGTKAFQNFTGGGYFFVDQKGRIWSATKTSHLFVISESADGTRLVKTGDYDLTSALTANERVTSALPDFSGRIWFVSKKDGKVGVLNTRTRAIHVLRTGEEIENSFAVDRDAIYIVSDKRMYRFSAGKDGKPRIDWKVTYRNSGIHKPSQVDAGSGTTPTIMSGGYVAITDNADPMNVVVYRTAKALGRGQKRVVCEVPVFGKGGSATENSLNTAGRSLVVENNYGYQDPFGTTPNLLTRPGFARVDVNAKGTGCRRVWTNTTEHAPTVVPKLSTKTGLIYSYVRDPATDGSVPWSWVAIDFRTGKTAFRKLAGVGAGFNNNYAAIGLGADGSAYLGTITGVTKLRDG
jgi:hypothetical protein